MEGTLVIISAPSGGGKTTIIKKLIERIPHTARVVTTTTRLPRSNETDGIDYYFLDPLEFEEKKLTGDFVESVRYAGNYYGLEKAELERKLAVYSIVFALLETRGKSRLDELNIPHISIFILPESIETLGERIGRRGTSSAIIKRRLAIAEKEITASKGYHYTIKNREGRLEETIGEIMKILDKNSPV